MNRGEIVLVHIPFINSIGGKIRPALIVQNDPLNQVLRETVVAEITSNVAHRSLNNQAFIEVSTLGSHG